LIAAGLLMLVGHVELARWGRPPLQTAAEIEINCRVPDFTVT